MARPARAAGREPRHRPRRRSTRPRRSASRGSPAASCPRIFEFALPDRAARLRSRARQAAPGRGRAIRTASTAATSTPFPPYNSMGEAIAGLSAGRRDPHAAAHDGARRLLHGLAGEEAPRRDPRHQRRLRQRGHAARAVRHQERHLRLRQRCPRSTTSSCARRASSTGRSARRCSTRSRRSSTSRSTDIPIYELAFIWGVGPRVEESGAGLIPGFAYSAPARGPEAQGTVEERPGGAVLARDRHRRHLHRHRRLRPRQRARRSSRKVLTTHDDPARARRRRASRRLLAQARARPARVRARRARHHALHQRADRAQGRARPGSSPPRASATRSRSGASASTSSTTSTSPSPSRWCRATCASRCPSACGADGSVRAPLDDGRCWRARRPRWRRAGVESIAIVFLHAYANPRHEARGRRGSSPSAIPSVAVTTSHEVAPEIREYERASTTVGNAYIKPLAARYLALDGAAARGARHPGAAAAHAVERRPHPRGGGQAHAGAAAGVGPGGGRARRRLLRPRRRRRQRCWPSTWAAPPPSSALVDGGEPLTAYSFEAARAAALHRGQRPAHPHLDHRADRDRRRRRLDRPPRRDRPAEGRAAQRRLAARPGLLRPAAAREPTVTDADFLLGYLNPDYFAGGEMAIDMAAARAAVEERSPSALGLDADRGRVGHPRRRQREHGGRRARAHRRARPRPARLRAALHRRRRPVHAYYVAPKLGLAPA